MSAWQEAPSYFLSAAATWDVGFCWRFSCLALARALAEAFWAWSRFLDFGDLSPMVASEGLGSTRSVRSFRVASKSER